MNEQLVNCDDDRLAALLAAQEKSPEGYDESEDWLEHIESCSRCQTRLRELAGNEDDWRIASEVLDVAGAAWQGSSTRLEGTTNWTESMARQLLTPPSHPELLGRIGRYDVERLIGSGGMGVVFKAHDTELNRPVAVKLLAPYLATSGSARNRFAREARSAAGVVDDHVVPIFNVETEDEPPFLVMQFIAGGSLHEKLERDGPLQIADVVRIGMQVAKGLAAAHAQGLIHRDVKPSNILLDEGVERALITDFGLARAEHEASLTYTGFHPGTPQYMSPEQIRGEAIDARSDLFGLGCVLYATCAGYPPFRAESSFAVLRQVTDQSPRPLREINAAVPAWLEVIVMKLLAKSACNRYQSAEEVAELLEGCLAHLQQPTVVPLPANIEVAAPKSKCETDLGNKRITKRSSKRRGILPMLFRREPPLKKLLAAFAIALPLLLLGIVITLETNKGTITIESEFDDVPVVITKGDEVYEELTVDRDGKSIRVYAGEYEVAFKGKLDRMAIDNGTIELGRGTETVVRIFEKKKLVDSSLSEQLITNPASDFEQVENEWVKVDEKSIATSDWPTVSVTQSGEIRFKGSPVSIEQLHEVLETAVKDYPGLGVKIQCDSDCSYDKIVRVIAVCELTKANFSIGTMPKQVNAKNDAGIPPSTSLLSGTPLQVEETLLSEMWQPDASNAEVANAHSLTQLASSSRVELPNTAGDSTVAQLLIAGPIGLEIGWIKSKSLVSDAAEQNAPTRAEVMAGGTVGFRLTKLPGKAGVELSATIEIAPITPATEAMVQHTAIPIRFTDDDFEQAISGNLVRKVLYLPDPEYSESAIAGINSLVSTRIEPGVDPIAEAERQGTVLAVLTIGNRSTDSLRELLEDREATRGGNETFKAPVPTVTGVDGEYIEVSGSEFRVGMALYVYRDSTTKEGFVGVATAIQSESVGRVIAAADPDLCVQPFVVGDKVYEQAIHDELKTHKWFLTKQLANARAEREEMLITITQVELVIAELDDEIEIPQDVSDAERERFADEERILKKRRKDTELRAKLLRQELAPIERRIQFLEKRMNEADHSASDRK